MRVTPKLGAVAGGGGEGGAGVLGDIADSVVSIGKQLFDGSLQAGQNDGAKDLVDAPHQQHRRGNDWRRR